MEKRVPKYAKDENSDNRYGVIWTDEEDARLMKSLQSGLSMQLIAEAHKRTPKAIEIRLAKLAAKEVHEISAPVQSIATKYRVTETMINKELKFLQRKEKKEKKEAGNADAADTVPRLNKKELVQKVIELEKKVSELIVVVNSLATLQSAKSSQ